MGKWTRRGFIATGVLAGGALVVGVAIRPGKRNSKVAGVVADADEAVINIWLKISPDNTVTAIIPHAEMGQGIHTTLAMMLADEMEADWSKVRVMEAPAHEEYANYTFIRGFLAGEADFPSFLVGTVDGAFLTLSKTMKMQLTAGSTSVRFTGRHAMRVAGAAAKAVLLQAAADKWALKVDELEAKNGMIHHFSSDRSAPFSEFAHQAADLSAPAKPRLKSDKDFKLMGTSPPRLDIPAKVDGTAGYGIDAMVPAMKYATIKAPPVFGSRIKSLDTEKAVKMPGVQKIVQLDDAIVVIADGYWQAKQALEKVSIEYEENSNGTIGQEDIFQQYTRDLDKAIENGDQETDFESGDLNSAIDESTQVIEAEYRVPYLAHATMEPMNATVWVHDGKCEVWTGCQNPLGFRSDVAEVLDLQPEQVTIYNQYLGGGFGRRAESDVAKQAARIANEVEFPVKLIWSREEDTRQGFYREANISRFRAGLNSDGQPKAWENQFLFKHHPPEAPYIPYAIDNLLIHYTESRTHIPWGNWRSVDHSMHGFFTESFIDELANVNQEDPYAYRRQLLSLKPRYLKVLDLAARKSNWGDRLPVNWGRGIAIHKSFGTIVAEVAEVEIGDGGNLRVHKVVCVADPGIAVHPDGFTAQMESGIIYGLTAALYGEITIEKGAVVQSNFHDYPMLRIDDTPTIETYIINSGHSMGGAGEPSTPVIAPAVANAIFNASGKRIRELPFMNHDLRIEGPSIELM